MGGLDGDYRGKRERCSGRLAISNATQVTLRLDYEPEGAVEKAGDLLQLVQGRVGGDLDRFKEFIESRGPETGGWRGEVKPSGDVEPDTGQA